MIRRLCGVLCSHINILSLIITGMEYLAVSCGDCKKIRLINLQEEDHKPIVACTSQKEELGPMCLGEAGTLYTVGKYYGVVSVLDCSTTSFALKRKIPTNTCILSDICYMDRSGFIAACSFSRIFAISNDGCRVWNISTWIDNKAVGAEGLVYLSDQDLLLVNDRQNKRIIVVTGSAGYIVQVIHVHDELDDLYARDNRLTALLKDGRKLSIYTVS